ncbi:hypothetical protein [Fontivita pretiosa]|uniref:hypothetical protein n=1 Tax=Fontivita pretiosa TaxID=2989684 RepID=UPI003D180C45
MTNDVAPLARRKWTIHRAMALLAALAAMLAAAGQSQPSTAWAQTSGGYAQPAAPAANETQVGSGTQPTLPPAGADLLQGYRPSGGYPETYNPNVLYPGQELRVLPGARANAVAARAVLRQAESALDRAVADVTRVHLRSAELQRAIEEERAAWKALEDVRAEALSQLKDDENYLALQRLRQRLAEQLEQLRRREEKPSIDQIVAIASLRLEYAMTVSAMEAAAVAANPAVRDARQRLVRASQRLRELRRRMEDAVRNDEQVILARRAVQDARIAALASDAYFVEARNVAEIAMDYAYFIRNRPVPYFITPYPNYGGYGYGYPVGYPMVGYPIGYRYNHSRPAPPR